MKLIEKDLLLAVAPWIAFITLGTVGCGSSLAEPGNDSDGSPGGAGTTGNGGSAATGTGGAGGAMAVCKQPYSGEVPSEHCTTAPACQRSNQPPVPDGGIPSCTTDSDCTANPNSLFRFCFRGQCSLDQCLTDAECGSTGVCACSSDYYGGNAAYHPNFCVPANCRIDSDCGLGGYCSPSRGRCGTFEGFYCHTSTDSCVDSTADCSSCSLDACVYSPAVAAFTCGSVFCNG